MKNKVRKNIENLKPYKSARNEYKKKGSMFLDANENPYGKFNRYPDPFQTEIKNKLSALKKISSNQIFLGNGSDEIIDLSYRIFCEPGEDEALIFPPTYGVYEFYANMNNVSLNKFPLNIDFQIDTDGYKKLLDEKNIKLIFLCSPNNPTANILDNLEEIISATNAMVFLDEAYIDFSNTSSFLKNLKNYNNLIISRSFSKGPGLAGARLGVAYASEEIISYFNKVKPPYNVSVLSQNAAMKFLDSQDEHKQIINLIIDEREKMKKNLEKIDLVDFVYDSETNYLLVKVFNAKKVVKELQDRRIIVRDRSDIIDNCIRITIGDPDQNKILIKELKKLDK